MNTLPAEQKPLRFDNGQVKLDIRINDGKVAFVDFVGTPPRWSGRRRPLDAELFGYLKKNGLKGDRIVEMIDWAYAEFTEKALRSLLEIPAGKLISYGELAKIVGNHLAARAVGQALGANKTPVLIPCHRVISSDGSLGGFSAGLSWKRYLLDLEKARYADETDR